ncbi:hypothetical protein Patl1_15124 [Pistacia atlantica]|uniref:Uncharacterized protein n=1 Tax=Pistacia atlantica TaxID=434234 RepID=A0ACC1B781_9ROSI|nr:hypothetical protein Patl1_15124 [Pistacia atlantica]
MFKILYLCLIGFGIGGSTVVIVVPLIWFIRRRKKQKHVSFNSRFISSDPSSRSEQEVGSVCFRVPVFSNKKLAEATNNFSHEKELGDGGFGTVYYGGREVAVKRFHEHSYKNFEQSMNEIEILTQLRHRNPVSLYGCTSRHSPQGLLLVYEYIPNELLKRGAWFTFVAYSLFPTGVTHVSAAPQGSPGYADPEYHLCYQLTDKNDEVKRMMTTVAELAFLCLQQNKEMIPSMEVALSG